MTITVRAYSDDDAEFVMGTRKEWEPTIGEDFLLRLVSGHVAPIAYLGVAEVGGKRAGYAMVTRPTDTPNPVKVAVVRRAQQGQGVGRALVTALDEVLPGETAESWVSDSDERDLAIAQHWGYSVMSHSIESLLTKDKVGPTSELPVGYTAKTTADADIDSDFETQVDALMLRGSTHPEFVELGWTISVAELRNYSSDSQWSFIMQGDDPVAACIAAPKTAASWVVGFTVVDPDHRGKGLARIVKQHLHLRAIALGAADLATRNEERNVGIRALNASMGYEKIGGEYRLKREATAP
jgi:GNAT superfamily N-acetyltransferase